MPKASKKICLGRGQRGPSLRSNQPDTNDSSQEDIPSSDQESDTEVIINPPRTQPQVIPSMFMPYIEGPKMDWTVNDGLTIDFLKWCLNVKIFWNVSLRHCQKGNSVRRS